MSRAKTTTRSRFKLPLRARITCPHCWNEFRPGEVLWVSAHPDLVNDARLGPNEQQRFLPTRFTVDGLALDVRGLPCKQLACPNCHLIVPRSLLQMPPLFISILGAPSSGKSYFLASMTWRLRQTMAKHFAIGFGDADPVVNQTLNDYEETLFLNREPQRLTMLRKTETEGEDWYDSVQFGDRSAMYSKPFVFSMQPDKSSRGEGQQKKLSRALCLYDNAGEHFLPGYRTGTGDQVTQHLAVSRALLFLFDPTQHPAFREACRDSCRDPQLTDSADTTGKQSQRQDQVVLEAASRIRAQTGLAEDKTYPRPLIVVVTKYDAWASMASGRELDTSWVVKSTPHGVGLAVDRLKGLSDQLHRKLLELAPELVGAINSFADDVTYIPVSALGCSPVVDPNSGHLMIRPADVRPQFVEVPLLYALHRAAEGLIPSVDSQPWSQAPRKPVSQSKRRETSPKLLPKTPKKHAPDQKQQPDGEPPRRTDDASYLAEPAQNGYLAEPASESYLAEPASSNEAAKPADQDDLKETGT